MFRTLTYITFFFFWANNLSAQFLHDPTEINRIMENSKIQYVLDSLPFQTENKIYPLVEKDWMAVTTANGIILEKQDSTLSENAEKFYQKGMKAYQKANYEKAISFYKKALVDHPTSAKLMKRIGRSYDARNNNKAAMNWYQQVIDRNFIDFEAHFLIAYSYQQNNNQDKAIYHITLAHLLNRNNKAILKALKEIYLSFGIEYDEWILAPVYKISKTGNKVQISAQEIPWRSYANCKAIWQYEPDYRDKMKSLSKEKDSIIEEKECLLNALIAFEKKGINKSNYPALKTLSKILAQRKVNNYLLYEVNALLYPTELIKLPKEKLENLIEYILTYHIKNYEN